jgi:hypothetical protein
MFSATTLLRAQLGEQTLADQAVAIFVDSRRSAAGQRLQQVGAADGARAPALGPSLGPAQHVTFGNDPDELPVLVEGGNPR